MLMNPACCELEATAGNQGTSHKLCYTQMIPKGKSAPRWERHPEMVLLVPTLLKARSITATDLPTNLNYGEKNAKFCYLSV